MKHYNSKYLNLKRLILSLVVILSFIPAFAYSQETYVFERMWPTLQQPWYFLWPQGIASDPDGGIYVVDSWNDRILKFTFDGKFITKWGREGGGSSEFSNPEGIAVDIYGHVYVADTYNRRVQKFTSDGAFITKWGSEGSGNGQFSSPKGIAIDSIGNVYVTDSANDCIQKFTSDGMFITKWGSDGSGNGQLSSPEGIAIDSIGNVYVADTDNHRIQKFEPNGEYLTQWGINGSGNGEFSSPQGVALGTDGNVYVTDTGNHRVQVFTSGSTYLGQWNLGSGDGDGYPNSIAIDNKGSVYVSRYYNDRIEKFSQDGTFIVKWASLGFGDGEFWSPDGVAIDQSRNIYVADGKNKRIQKFSMDGAFLSMWGSAGTGDGEFVTPTGLAVGLSGNVYVLDTDNNCIQKFTSNGTFLKKWGSTGSGNGELNHAYGITLDQDENVYVADTYNNRIQKFDSNGTFLGTWGTYGSGNGELSTPWGIALDRDGNVYVAEKNNNRIQVFSPTGDYITKWGSEGAEDGKFRWPYGIALDGSGNIFVVDMFNHRIQKFTVTGDFITAFGAFGSDPSALNWPSCISISPSGRVYVTDSSNNRVQVFKRALGTESKMKAIVVAGGGPFRGNNLWGATQMSANFAYRTLAYQGFTKDTIYYLTSNTDLDLDSNGEPDDVDGDTTNANFQNAITTWTADADNLVVYLVDHGGDGTFRMSGTEILSASNLDSWLDQLQQTIPGKVTVIYDACESGSFLSALTPPVDKERVVITSTSPGESAYFVTQGSISFSNYFWTHIFNGEDIKDAFFLAKDAIGYTTDFQTPLLDADGDGEANDADDFTIAQNTWIGNGTIIQGDAPAIESVSGPQTISGETSAVLSAFNVTDNDGIARVWAVIRPPDYNQGSSDNPVQGLPNIDLMPVGGDQYDGTYDGFNIAGTYQIAIYARDRIGNTSIPQQTEVSVNNPLRRRAIIVAGGAQSDLLWPAIERNVKLSYESLSFQGYSDDDIYLMSPVSIQGVTKMTVLSTLSNLNFAITNWALSNTQDVVIYLVGNGGSETFELSSTETLSANDLDAWLDTFQNSIPGKATVIYDACQSGSFLPSLVPPAGKERILISSSTGGQPAHFLSKGDISFSKFFWRAVLNGTSVRDSFLHAKNAMAFSQQNQTALLDDNNNGVGNEKSDGQIARYYTLGVGIMLAGDDPLIGSVTAEQILTGQTSTALWAQDVTTTGTIDRVWAVITPPQDTQTIPDLPVTDLPQVDLVFNGSNNRWEGIYDAFSVQGTYAIAFYALDTQGNLSIPATTTVVQTVGMDVYEEDDTFSSASLITINAIDAQRHRFHDGGDQDWIRFYGITGESYEIKTENLGSACDTVITLYEPDGITEIVSQDDSLGYGENEVLSWLCPADGIYYVKTEQYDPADYGNNTEYDLRVYQPVGGTPGLLIGQITDQAGNGIGGALVKADGLNITAISLPTGYFLMVLPTGTYTITAEMSGYPAATQSNVTITTENHASLDYTFDVVYPGDVNEDGSINLADAILAFHVACGMDVGGGSVAIGTDVNEDGKIGIAEAIYVLQEVSGLRQ